MEASDRPNPHRTLVDDLSGATPATSTTRASARATTKSTPDRRRTTATTADSVGSDPCGRPRARQQPRTCTQDIATRATISRGDKVKERGVSDMTPADGAIMPSYSTSHAWSSVRAPPCSVHRALTRPRAFTNVSMGSGSDTAMLGCSPPTENWHDDPLNWDYRVEHRLRPTHVSVRYLPVGLLSVDPRWSGAGDVHCPRWHPSRWRPCRLRLWRDDPGSEGVTIFM